MTPSRAVRAVQACLTDDLRHAKYRGHRNPLRGHCYVAAEAVYHLLGGLKSEWKPATLRGHGEVHWFLRNEQTGEVVDPTAGQFQRRPLYTRGRGRGFLTRRPSKRARAVLACARTR